MKIATAFRNLDPHGRHRAPEVIEEETHRLEKHLTRFKVDLVRLEVTVSQTKAKTRISASLRLQLPSGVIAAREDGFEVEPVIRKAFADLLHQLDRHLARLKRESLWKRPARRAKPGALLPPAKDKAEAERRALYFDLIEDQLDKVYDTVRRELTYLEASGAVPQGRLDLRAMVDAAILKGLDRFEKRPTEFSVDAWLSGLALETVEAEARAARRAVPDDTASLEQAPEAPVEEPTEADQEMFEFYQPDAQLLLEDLVRDDSAADPETETARHEAALALHRAIADLPTLWRKVLYRLDLEDDTPVGAAALLGLSEDTVAHVADSARAFLREKLRDAVHAYEYIDETLEAARKRPSRIPQPHGYRERIESALAGEGKGVAS